MVKSVKNPADSLTHVNKKWLSSTNTLCVNTGVMAATPDCNKHVTQIHKQYYGEDIDENIIRNVVKDCETCRRIDPASINWEKGSSDVAKVWHRLAVDITHYQGVSYLSLID